VATSDPVPVILLDAAAVAERWSCSQRYVYEVAQRGPDNGGLASIRFGRRLVRFRLEDVQAFEQQHLEAATA
jgi:excisionase family DNA binding protein